MLNIQYIKARDLGDAWFQTIFKILDEGTVFKIDSGSFQGQKRLEFDWITIHINRPGDRPLLPQIEAHFNIPNPVSNDYLDSYLPYLMTGEIAEDEAYTYGSRITKDKLQNQNLPHVYKQDHMKNIYKQDKEIWKNVLLHQKTSGSVQYSEYFLSQVDLLIWTYKNKGYRNNQMVLQVAKPEDILLKDSPCLRHIDTRIQNGKLHFYPYFRSWDAYGGFPANLGGIQLLKEYIADEIGVEDGEIIATSKGLHIYDYTFDIVKRLRMREDKELKNGDKN